MSDDHEFNSEYNRFPSATAAVGSERRASTSINQPTATTSEAYFDDSQLGPSKKNGELALTRDEQNTLRGNENNMPCAENNIPNLPSAMWASFFRGMAESFHTSETGTVIPKANPKKLKPSDVYIASFDSGGCVFMAAQWCEEVDHYRTQNAWTDYETKNAAFT